MSISRALRKDRAVLVCLILATLPVLGADPTGTEFWLASRRTSGQEAC
jgi:hypothetical protein